MLKKLLVITFSTTLILGLFSTTTNAEDDIDCTGRIEGQALQANSNVGTITFDAHPYNLGQKLPENTVYNVNTNLAVVGLGDGLAPATRSNAACLSQKSSVSVALGAGEFAVRGYAWSENLGFISFNCDSCVNKYGVKVEKDGAGYKLTGYAWNEAFGYISMSSQPADAIQYGVKVGADGKVSGYAYSAAGVYINFSGVTFFLPGVVKPVLATDYCNSPTIKPVCVQFDPDPDTLKSKSASGDGAGGSGGSKTDPKADPKADLDGNVKIADGKDFYQIHLYLRDAAGAALDLNKLNELSFAWKDTVKADQTVEGEKNFDADSTPVNNGGAVIYKPTVFKGKADLEKYFDNLGGGHYQLKSDYTIRSYAPTTNENFSYTTNTVPPFPVNNETFFTKVGAFDANNIKPNVLKLMSLKLKYNGQDMAPVYPNGKDGLSLRFRPAFELKMFANNSQDSILGVRGIPVNYNISGRENGKLLYSGLDIRFYLDYDKDASKQSCGSADAGGFLVHFLKDFNGQELENTVKEVYLSSISAITSAQDLQSWAILPEDMKESPCQSVEGPTIYSEVKYTAAGKSFNYFSDKLPRVTSEIANPTAVVHGSIIASKAFSPNAEKSVQETGNVAVNIIRNTIHENVETRMKAELKGKYPDEGGDCKITNLKDDGTASVSCEENGNFYKTFSIDGEHVIYFKDSSVALNLSSQADKWVVVAEEGDIFIDSNIYNSPMKSLSLVALRPYSSGCNTGNIYIHKDVKNIQANIFTDCSVFSYVDKDGIGADGTYKWGSFMEMVSALSNQLKIEGSIASHNTIGGADSDKLGYLRDGFGKIYKLPVKAEDRLRVQQYDLNFLRLSKGELQKAENGLPIDQSCQKALSIEEILQVQKYQEYEKACNLFGCPDVEILPVVGEGDYSEVMCDGIDPLTFYDSDLGTGDLKPILGNLASGLDEGQYDPVYIYYAPTDSFVFSSK